MLREFLSDHEVQVSFDPIPHKIVLVVTFQGHSIYKSTFVSQLNGNPYLSKDKLTRMQNSIYFINSDDYLTAASLTTSMLLGLGFDLGVYFKDSRGPTTSSTVMIAKIKTRDRPIAVNRGVNNMMLYIGKVQKIRVKVGTKWGNCRQPINLMKRAVQNANRGMLFPMAMAYFHWFKKLPSLNKYRYVESDCV